MVVKDGFRLALFDPDKKDIYYELNSPDGTAYVEAFPDAQYFIQFQLDGDPANNATVNSIDQNNKIEVHFKVDQNDLKYRRRVPKSCSVIRCGKWIGGSDHQALKFTIPKLSLNAGLHKNSNETSDKSLLSVMRGTIRASFYESVYHEPTPASLTDSARSKVAKKPISSGTNKIPDDTPEDKDEPQREEPVDLIVSAQQQNELKYVKAIRSTPGSARLINGSLYNEYPALASSSRNNYVPPQQASMVPAPPPNPRKSWSNYTRGRHLTTITLHYCSTVGLILAGILPKPHPTWSPQKGKPRQSDCPLPAFIQQVVTRKRRYEDDNGLEREVFEHDLTEISEEE